MSILSSEPAGATPAGGGEGTQGSDADRITPSADPQVEPNFDEPAKVVEHVPLPPKGGRRAAAAQQGAEIAKQFEEFKSTFSKQQEELRASLAAKDAEIARIRGGFEALQPLVQQRQQPQQQVADPATLRREATALLDKGDFAGYQEKFAESIRAETLAAVQRSMPQPQAQQHPVITALLAQNPAVLAAGQRGMALAQAYDNVLAANGSPDGPDRWAKAMQMAGNDLGGGQRAPQGFAATPQQRESLAGIPTGRPAGNTQPERQPGVSLNENDMKWMRAAGMTKEEFVDYIAKYQPNRIER